MNDMVMVVINGININETIAITVVNIAGNSKRKAEFSGLHTV